MTRQTDLTALRDELREYSEHGTIGNHGIRMVMTRWADRLTDLLGSLPPQEQLDLDALPTQYIGEWQDDDYVHVAWVRLPNLVAALGSLPVPDTEALQKLIAEWRDNSTAANKNANQCLHSGF